MKLKKKSQPCQVTSWIKCLNSSLMNSSIPKKLKIKKNLNKKKKKMNYLRKLKMLLNMEIKLELVNL
jgi:hypothetical protein